MLKSPFSRLSDIEVFAVEPRAAQLLVRTDAPTVRARVGTASSERSVDAAVVQGVAVVELDQLSPATTYSVELETTSGATLGTATFTTSADRGAVTAKVATVSDVHLGLDRFGVGRKLTDDSSTPYAFRCARAAIAEAIEWGAELLVVKGDLTDTGQADEWDLASELLSDVAVPVMFTPGNHDVLSGHDVDPADGAALLGLDFAPVQIRDLADVRLILADTSRHGSGTGDLARMTDALLEAVDCTQPVLLAFHHNIQHLPVPWFWPPGIASTNAMPVVKALEEANPRLMLTSGHTHRNRLHWLGNTGSIPYTEVSSTSDYPGVWAGYSTHASGIHQVVRRISAADAIEWTERTRSVLGGVWPRWSQGVLEDRTVDVEFGSR